MKKTTLEINPGPTIQIKEIAVNLFNKGASVKDIAKEITKHWPRKLQKEFGCNNRAELIEYLDYAVRGWNDA